MNFGKPWPESRLQWWALLAYLVGVVVGGLTTTTFALSVVEIFAFGAVGLIVVLAVGIYSTQVAVTEQLARLNNE